MDSLDLSDRIFQGDVCYQAKSIDYDKKKAILLQQIDKSKSFLFNSLAKENGSINQENYGISVAEYKNSCIGCGACSYKCPTKAINIELGQDGFFKANIDKNKCVACKKCIEICPFIGKDENNSLAQNDLYAYQDCAKVLKNTSSGGAAYRLAKLLLHQGYSVIGCAYDYDKNIAKHIVVKEEKDLDLVKGSKYIQSFFCDAFDYIESSKEAIAVFGTPCQISAVKAAFPERKNIICIELICHGVPTYNLFEKYIDYLKRSKKIVGNIKMISFRDKIRGWHTKIMHILSEGRQYHDKKDLFYRMYNSGVCYSEACYECRWREKSSADLRLGDYWGNKYSKEKLGVSMVIPNSIVGKNILVELENYKGKKLFLKQDIRDYYNSQQVTNAIKPLHYEEIMDALNDKNSSFEDIVKKYADPICRRNSFYDKVLRIYGKKK